ncbi:hypothetical protein SAMN02745687_00913 [Lachnospiraceae bacterium NK3A20]|nr:hypothetical protein SAMN02745687_00913 [Lachnospiraceae bacterium NK3A20]
MTEKGFTQGISIDGEFFDVPILSIDRTGSFLDKYVVTTEDGTLHREPIGVYYNYEMSFGYMDTDTHQRLWAKLSEAMDFHKISLPDAHGTYNFSAYVASLSDEYRKIYTEKAEFKNLKCKFVAKELARKRE